MKKLFFVVFFSFTALLISCKHDGSNEVNNELNNAGFHPLPVGVYIAGITFNQDGESQACYWNGNDRILLNGGEKKMADTISVSDGRILVTGGDCYWIDGEQHELTNYTNSKAVISGGKVYKMYNAANIWIDEVEITYPASSPLFNTNFKAHDIAVFNNVIYLAGIYNPPPNPLQTVGYLFSDQEQGWTWHNIISNTDVFSFFPEAITISNDGTVYIVGTDSKDLYFSLNHSKAWYYTKGWFYELEGFDENNRIKKITISDGKLHVFDFLKKPEYWVDGKKYTVITSEYSDIVSEYSEVNDIAISEGTVYTAGNYAYLLPNGKPKMVACYWVDGERYDLDGFMATAIYVEE